MTGLLRLVLLGAPQLWIDDKPVTGFITSKTKALFYYLAVTGRPHTRATLAGLLWPDNSESRALKNLRDILPNLRRLLDPYLLVTRDQLAFNRQSLHWLDVHAFWTGLEADLTTEGMVNMQKAVDLYHGDFLAGFSIHDAPAFEAWMHAQRDSLSVHLQQGLHRLIDAHIVHKTYGDGLSLTRRLLALEPWDERAHRQQMWLLTMNGQRSNALEQYDICRRLLAEKLGAEPSIETTELYESIRAEKIESQGELSSVTPPPYFLSAAIPQHNLPREMTPLIGRAADIAHIQGRLLNQAYPLVTLVGEDGIGKTRLALAVAKQMKFQFPDGVWFIPLANLTSGESWHTQLAAAILNALKLTPIGSAPLKQQLLERLRDKNLLLAFDKFDQIRSSGDFILDLLQAAPKVKILVTAHQRLNLYGEYVYHLKGLSVPNKAAEVGQAHISSLLQYDSIQLFIEHAQRIIPNFQLTEENQAAVMRICCFVEGLPMGIKLAATLLEQHTCETIANTLEAGDLLSAINQGELSTRHHHIQRLLAYSWQFLAAPGAGILTQCSVFQGGFTAEAAAAITGATPIQLQRLVDQSFLRKNEAARFELHGLVGQYATKQLGMQPEVELQTRRRHSVYFVSLLHDWQFDPASVAQNEHSLHRDLDNLRTAWNWALAQQEWALLERCMKGLFLFYQYAGYYHEAANVANQAIEQLRQQLHGVTTAPPLLERTLAKLLLQQIDSLFRLGQTEEMEQCLQEVLHIGERLALSDVQTEGYLNLGWIEFRHANWVAATDAAERSLQLARQSTNPRLEANALNALGIFWGYRREHGRAIAYLQSALVLAQQLHYYSLESTVLINMGEHYKMFAEYAQAFRYFQQARATAFAHQYREDIGVTAYNLANLFQILGAWSMASDYFEEALTYLTQIGETYFASLVRIYWARLFYQMGDSETAINYCVQAQQRCHADDHRDIEPRAWNQLGRILSGKKHFSKAEAAYHEVLTLTTQEGGQTDRWIAQAGLAQLYLEQHQLAKAKLQVDALWPFLSTLQLNDPYEQPFDLMWPCYCVLIATDDSRAPEVLRRSYQLLMEQARKIDDEVLRHSFLENVWINRQIVEAVDEIGR